MEIIGFHNCKDSYEAHKKEQEYFEILHATLNSIEPMPKPKLKIEKIPPTEKKIYYCDISYGKRNHPSTKKCEIVNQLQEVDILGNK